MFMTEPQPSELALRVLKQFNLATTEAVITHLEAGRKVTGIRNGVWVELGPEDLKEKGKLCLK